MKIITGIEELALLQEKERFEKEDKAARDFVASLNHWQNQLAPIGIELFEAGVLAERQKQQPLLDKIKELEDRIQTLKDDLEYANYSAEEI